MALAIGIAVHCDGCVAFHTKMAHQHGAGRDEVAETVALAVSMGGGPAAVHGADALRAYDQFAGTMPQSRRRARPRSSGGKFGPGK